MVASLATKTRVKSFFLSVIFAAGLVFSASSTIGQTQVETDREAKVTNTLRSLLDTEAALTFWLRQMPKGGDLHNHLVGAIYAESYLEWAAQDGHCIDPLANAIIASLKCEPPLLTAREAIQQPQLYEQLLQSLSMRDFNGSSRQGTVSGHGQFFSTFDRFMAASINRDGDMLAEVADRAAANGVTYLELMHSPGMFEAASAAPQGMGEDWAAQWDADKPRLADIAQRVTRQMDEAFEKMNVILNCKHPEKARPGCNVQIRFLAQVVRVFPANQVFAQSALGFLLVEKDPRFVGINLVGPEHSPVTQRDYMKQMQQLGWLKSRWPSVPISLHAGELTWGLVAPEQMRSHIRQAIEVAGASRIGHGVSIAHEEGADDLIETMALKKIAVEINLTSNDVILGVRGRTHPLHWYLSSGVPVVLSTDDEGVSRIDITHEYLRAMTDHDLDYIDLKQIARNSITYAFVSGESFWQDLPKTRELLPVVQCSNIKSQTCTEWLGKNLKARLQLELEEKFAEFENTILTQVKQDQSVLSTRIRK